MRTHLTCLDRLRLYGLKFRWAEARRDGQDIVVHNDSVSNPIAVRYDWMDTPEGNLFNAAGLPAVPFKTDDPALAMHIEQSASGQSKFG